MKTVVCDCCMKEIQDVIYPVVLWAFRFDFCQSCYENSLRELLSNRMLMQIDNKMTKENRKKPGKEILN